jgi:hypothetical protein
LFNYLLSLEDFKNIYVGGKYMTLTALQLAPISAAVTENVAILLPVGIAIMACLIAVSLIPKIIYRFF